MYIFQDRISAFCLLQGKTIAALNQNQVKDSCLPCVDDIMKAIEDCQVFLKIFLVFNNTSYTYVLTDYL